MSRQSGAGPRCIHCDQLIYHTAPGGRWAHQATNNARCDGTDEDLEATPQVLRR